MFNIKKLVIKIAIFVLNVMYLPFKCFKTKHKLTYISRQSDTPSIDFTLLYNKMKEIDSSLVQVMLTKKIGKGIVGKLKYGLHTFVQMYHIATSKVVVIDTYIIPVSVLKHKKSLKVVQIWHALGAIKKVGYQVIGKGEGSSEVVAHTMKMHAGYDAVTTSSSTTAKFYAEAFNTDISKIKVVGMPRVDDILGDNKDTEILNLNPEYNGKKTILYIPTFRKNDTVYTEDIIKLVDTNKYNLVIKLHPLDSTKVDEKYLVKGGFSTYDMMKFADYIITDYSATAIEASVLNKPLFLYVYDLDNYNEVRGLNVNLTEELKTSTSKEFKDILEIIENDTYDYKSLEAFKNKYVETHNINNTESVCKLINEYLK